MIDSSRTYRQVGAEDDTRRFAVCIYLRFVLFDELMDILQLGGRIVNPLRKFAIRVVGVGPSVLLKLILRELKQLAAFREGDPKRKVGTYPRSVVVIGIDFRLCPNIRVRVVFQPFSHYLCPLGSGAPCLQWPFA
jgi:hypothetical protein